MERESRAIGIEIEPESVFLVSKDANNRIEADAATGAVLSASGGTLACRTGPNPTKALAHPAIVDLITSEYLLAAARGEGASMSEPFDFALGSAILDRAVASFDRLRFALMFQNIVSSSPGSYSYVFARREGSDEPVILQRYNRVFYMKDEAPKTVRLSCACARPIPTPTRASRERKGAPAREVDPVAERVLLANWVDVPNDRDVAIRKVTGIDPEWDVFIENRDLRHLSDSEYAFLRKFVDFDKYLEMAARTFDDNWRNASP